MKQKTRAEILSCSFCNKDENDVRKIIAGPAVFICDECVEVCNDILADDPPVRKEPEAEEDIDLLEGFEHVLEEVRRLSSALRSLIEAHQRGQGASEAVLVDYLTQLERLDADRRRMEKFVAALWTMVGGRESH